MRGLLIAGLVLLALFLLSLIRLRAVVRYGEKGLEVWARAGPIRLRVFPLGEKRPKKAGQKGERPPKKKKKGPPPPETGGPGGSLALVKEFLPVIASAAGGLRRRLQIDRLELDLTAAAADPAQAALAYGSANALIGMIWPVIDHHFNVRDRRIRTAVDFQRDQPAVYLWAGFSLRLGQAVSLAVRILVQCLGVLARHRQTQKEAV